MKRLWICLFFVAACSGGNKSEKKSQDDVTSPQPTTVLADDGPTLSVQVGTLKPVDLGTISAEATTVTTIGGHTYVEIPNTSFNQMMNTRLALDVVDAKQHAVATLAYEGKFFVRFVGKKAPESFAVNLRGHDSYGDFQGRIGRLNVTVPAKLPKNDDAEMAFYVAYGSNFDRGQSWRARSAFTAFAGQRLREYGRKLDPKNAQTRPQAPRRWTDMGTLVGLYSGVTSIRETLQQDRALWVRGENEKRTVDIKDVDTIKLEEHPWPEMLKALGKTPAIEPMAKFIPADMAYMHFHDLRTFAKLVGELDDWVSPVAQQFEGRIGARHFMSFYEKQLMLERSGIAEKIGHKAVHDVAILTGDAFLREGTDVSMVFRVKDQGLLDTALKAFELSHTSGRNDVKQETFKHQGVNVRRIYTPDMTLNQYRADYDGLTSISNTRGSITHLIDAVKTKKITTLDQSGDFQYMRAVQPFSEKNEDGFIFISDAFVMHSVSPEVRILNARRMGAEADILAINYSMMLDAILEGEMPTSIADSMKRGLLREEEDRHGDGAKISYSPERGAYSSWGSARMLKPVREMSIDKVTAGEASAYKNFAETYQNYWVGYFDPIGVQLTRTNDGKRLAFDVRVLPLVQNSEYDRLIETVGKSTTNIRPIKDGVTYTMAIGADAGMRRFAEFGTSTTLGTDIKFSWLGDWFQIGVADHSSLWDLAIVTNSVRNAVRQKFSNTEVFDIVQKVPVFAAAHVANQLALAGLLTKLKQYVNDAAPGVVQWGPKGDPYREIQIVTVSAKDNDMDPFSIHYAIVNDVIVVSLNEVFLKTQIDRFIDPKVSGEEIQSAIQVDLKPKSWLTQTAASIYESTAIDVHASALHQYSFLHAAFGASVDPRKHGLAFLGFEPRSPIPGSFTVKDGRAVHSSTGSMEQMTIEKVPLDTAVSTTLDRLANALGTISFLGDGKTTGLHATIEWEFE